MHKWTWLGILGIVHLLGGVAQASSAVPSWWMQENVGAVGVNGGTSISNEGELLISGSGNDIWGTSDSFFFLFQSMGDGRIFSSTASLEDTHPHAKIGIMFRQSTAAGSAHVMIDVQPDGSVEFMTRPATNAETSYIAGLPPAGHPWQLQLVRSNGIVVGSACWTDGCHEVGRTPFVDGFVFGGAVIVSHDNSVVNHGRMATLPYLYKVPVGWDSYDVNFAQAGHMGDAWFLHDQFTIYGYGTDIWGTSDSYRLVSQFMVGDGTTTARVTREAANNTYAKAGVIAVNDGKTVILDVRPNGLIEFMARSEAGTPMRFIAGGAASFPVWLKLQRVGSQFTGFISNDGTNWQFVGNTAVTMNNGISAGLAVTSHDPSQFNLSEFDHVTLTSNAAVDLDIGDVGAMGGSSPTGVMAYSIFGAGADIWGRADAFHFLYQGLTDDGQIRARVKQLDNTSPFAKAGVMIRATSDPASAHVILNVRPGGDLEFMTRTSSGAETTFLATAHVAFPVWLGLVRSGSTITGYYMQDNGSWTAIGTASPTLPSDVMAGAAITSHQRGLAASAMIDFFGK